MDQKRNKKAGRWLHSYRSSAVSKPRIRSVQKQIKKVTKKLVYQIELVHFGDDRWVERPLSRWRDTLGQVAVFWPLNQYAIHPATVQ
jgi:hypothetical protein